MKFKLKRLLPLVGLLALVTVSMFCLVASADDNVVAYAVEGGNIYFDKSTATITKSDRYITAANIPSEIGGAPSRASGNMRSPVGIR